MRAFTEFKEQKPNFWALVQFISETLKYSERKSNFVRTYSEDEIKKAFLKGNIKTESDEIIKVKKYCDLRADLLNNSVKQNLLTADTASVEFDSLKKLYDSSGFLCKIPMNKQKGQMKQVAYFTAMINIVTEQVLREYGLSNNYILGFNDDPRGLVYVIDDQNNLIGATSRRYDGAFPDIINPKIVWEIKEYYYATTFGSRVADGVYETQLDGYEFHQIENTTGIHIEHVFFIDAYKTWWEDGKSYLCRIVDALNLGLVDEVIVGREVLTRWPKLLTEIISQ